MGSMAQVHAVDKKFISNIIHKQVESKTMEERYTIPHKQSKEWLAITAP